MIFIVVKFPVKPEYAEKWLDLTRDFTEATRAEPGNKWFEWSRSVEDPNEFMLVEAFEDDGAAAHVNSAHFAQAMRPALRATPKIVSRQIDGDGWDAMGELTIDWPTGAAPGSCKYRCAGRAIAATPALSHRKIEKYVHTRSGGKDEHLTRQHPRR